MSMKPFWYHFFLIFIVIACQTETSQKKTSILQLNIQANEKITRLFDEQTTLDSIGISPQIQESLYQLYKQNNFDLFWNSDSTRHSLCDSVIHLTQNSFKIGIPPTRYASFKWKKHPILDDILTTLFVSSIQADLQHGILDSTKQWNDFRLVSNSQFLALNQKLKKDSQIELYCLAISPADSNYRFLLNGLRNFIQNNKMDKKSIEVIAEKKGKTNDSIVSNELKLASKALIERNFENDSTSVISIRKAVKEFQKQNQLTQDGKVGTATAYFLSETNQHKAERTCISLEKWRSWKAYPKTGVWVNLPDFSLKFFYDDTLRSSHRIVIGKPEHETPELCSSIRKLILYPYWGIPHSIAVKEVLPAVKANPNYLVKNKIRVFRKETEMDPNTIDWSKYSEKNFPFRLRQDPGSHNSLGIIKFEFSNSYSVYVHDTPSKSLFNQATRAFSHGCVRCEKPIELAKEVLLMDRNDLLPDSLDSLIPRKEQVHISLKKRIPICLNYVTVTADSDGKLYFHWDVYRRDEPYLITFRQNYRS